MAAYRQYRCLVSHYSDRFYRQNLVYLFASNPGARFALETNDDERNAAGVDLDGTWFPGQVGYDDWRFPLTQAKTGSNLKPDFDETNNGYLFPQNDTVEVLFMSNVSSHRMLIHPDAIWHPHLHYWQDEAGYPVFEYRIKITGAGGAVGAWSDWTPSIGKAPDLPAWSSGTLHQIIIFPPLRAYDLGQTTPAAMVDIQLRRNDNIVTGDVLAKEFDIHAIFDAPLGSGQEFLK